MKGHDLKSLYHPFNWIWVGLVLTQIAVADVEQGLDLINEAPAEITQAIPTPAQSSPILIMGLRLDTLYALNGVIDQGFSIPMLRVIASGSVSPLLSYRIALGQSREFSSVLLPQLIPVEAFVDVGRVAEGGHAESEQLLGWRLGMFSPSLNPWWTPDLGISRIADYGQLHTSLLLNRDVGTEVTISAFSEGHIKLGYFNGSGIYNLNTNNSKAITGLVTKAIKFDGETRLWLGISGYSVFQSVQGSVNFRSNWISNLYARLEWENAQIGLEILGGEFQDNLRLVQPLGIAGICDIPMASGLNLFGRFETGTQMPEGGNLNHFQLGPKLSWDSSVQLFLFYDYLENYLGRQNSGQFRLRITI